MATPQPATLVGVVYPDRPTSACTHWWYWVAWRKHNGGGFQKLLQQSKLKSELFRAIYEELDAEMAQRYLMREPFAAVVDNYSSNSPIVSGFEGSKGTCSGTVKAAGFAMNCSSDSISIPLETSIQNRNFTDVFVTNFTWRPATAVGEQIGQITQYNMPVNVWPHLPFVTYNLTYATGRSAPALSSVFSDTPGGNGNCNGTLVRQICSLLSATLDYPIKMVNTTIELARNSMSHIVDHIQAYGNESDWFTTAARPDPNPMTFSTLGGIAIAAQSLFGSTSSQLGGSIRMTGPLSAQAASFGTGNTSYETTQNACAINWADPTEQIIDALNELMFRTSLIAATFPKYKIMTDNSSGDWWRNYYEAYPLNANLTAADPGIPVAQMIQMQQTSEITVFQSHYSFLIAALAILIFGVMVVIPTFIGFWELGREMTLNPLEIAKAFNPNMLEGEGSNSSAKRMNLGMKAKEVRYGEVFATSPDALGLIRDGLKTRYRGRRLELADPNYVRDPEVDAVYL